MKKRTLIPARLVVAWALYWLVTSMAFAQESVTEETPAQPGPKITVIVLPFENADNGTELNHWSHAVVDRIGTALDAVETIRMMPGWKYAFRELGLEAGDAVDAAQAREIGELTEVRRVVWGAWIRTASQWHLETRILDTRGGNPAIHTTDASEDFFAATAQAADQVLETLQITPTESERREMEERPTRSKKAYELFQKARFLNQGSMPGKKIESILREALEIDPDYSDARRGLAGGLLSMGKTEEGARLTRQLLEQYPGDTEAIMLFGSYQMYIEHNVEEAEKTFLKASELDPDLARAHEELGNIYVTQGRLTDAMDRLDRARELRPFDAEINALIAFNHAKTGDREAARNALLEAARLNDEDADTEVILGQAYTELGQYPDAARHFEKALDLARGKGARSEVTRRVEQMHDYAKARLTTSFVEAARPQRFTQEELQAELANRLTPDELANLINPIEITPDMKTWAREQTEGVASELDRARRLFDLLTLRLRGRGKGGTRTAREVFGEWENPEATFSCQEYAKLYVGLAREIGLDAFYVHLEKDYRDKIVYHDCASVFIDDKALLVDPAYRWFGVPHQEYELLDDLQTIAHHAFQPGDEGKNIDRARLALKLHPDHAWGQIAAARAFFMDDDLDEAEKLLTRADELEPERWDGLLLRGMIARAREDFQAALQYLDRARAANPESGGVHSHRAHALSALGRYPEALDAFRAAVRHDNGYQEELVDDARQRIVELKELAGASKGDEDSIASIRRKAEDGDATAQNNLGTFFANRPDPDYAEAMRWVQLAADRDLALAQYNLSKFHAKGVGTEKSLPEAVKWLRLATENGNRDAPIALALCYLTGAGVEKDAGQWAKYLRLAAERGNPKAQFDLGMSYYQGKEVEKSIVEAHRWFSKAHAGGHRQAKDLLQELQVLYPKEIKKATNGTEHRAPQREFKAEVPIKDDP